MKRFAIVLAALFVLAGCGNPLVSSKPASAVPRVLTTTQGDGPVLNLWQWNFQAIQNVLPQVAASGYSAIQVSPVQGTKSSASLANGFAWYLFYQPTNLKVGNAQLGSEQDFKNLCAAAQTYGIKIIVDAVLNHVADNGTSGQFDPAVDSSIANSAYFHNLGTVGDWSNRYQMTQQNLGNGPDWNTQNSYVQSLHLAFLNQAIADGAGGFRFDAAKSIETNVGNDAGQTWAGSWWTTMLNGMTGASNLFLYGEVLSGTNDNDDGYQTFMRTTAVDYIGTVSSAIDSTNLSSGNLLNITHTGGYTATENPSKVVLYIENWDNYLGAVGLYTSSYSYTKRLLANAIMTARANAVNVVFARPNESLWSDASLAAVNNFKIAAAGLGEYLRNPTGNNAVLIVERGTLGATLINAGGSASITSATNLPNGSYTATPGGAVFTVSNGTLTGTVPGQTAVVIKASGTPPPTGYTSNYPSMSLRGTMNSWGTTAMTLTANNTWTASVTLAASTTYQYKFDASGAWTTGQNWGVGGVNGSNISSTTSSAGTYLFTFNDSTLAYSVTPPAVSGGGTFTVVFVNNGSAQNVTFPGDANNWSLTANTLSAAANSTSTITLANAVTAANLTRGNNTSTLELQICNTASGWSGAWGLGSWSKTSNIAFSNSGNSQISIACSAGQNVTLTVNVGSSSLSAVVQ